LCHETESLSGATQKGGSTFSFFNLRDKADFIPNVSVFRESRDESNIALVFADRYLASFCLDYPPELTRYLNQMEKGYAGSSIPGATL
jgi:hypothetical protein